MPAKNFTAAKQQILAGPDCAAKRFLLSQLDRRTGQGLPEVAPEPKPVHEQIRELDETPTIDTEEPWECG